MVSEVELWPCAEAGMWALMNNAFWNPGGACIGDETNAWSGSGEDLEKWWESGFLIDRIVSVCEKKMNQRNGPVQGQLFG